MINDSDKFSARIRWVENLFTLNERNSKYLFWFFSLITIPAFAYLYTLPFSLLLWLISELFGLSEKHLDALTKLGVIICFVFAFGTQLYLWKLYDNKRVQKEKRIT